MMDEHLIRELHMHLYDALRTMPIQITLDNWSVDIDQDVYKVSFNLLDIQPRYYNRFLKSKDKTQAVRMLELLMDGQYHGNLEISKWMGNGVPCEKCGEKAGVALRLTSVTHALRNHGVEIESKQVSGSHWEYKLLNPEEVVFTTKGYKVKKQLNLEDLPMGTPPSVA